MNRLQELQKENREIWGLRVGPKSNQFDQEKVLNELTAAAYLAALQDVEKTVQAMLPKAHEGDSSKDFKTGMFRGFEAVLLAISRTKGEGTACKRCKFGCQTIGTNPCRCTCHSKGVGEGTA